MKKRFLSILLVLVMVIGMIPAAFAADTSYDIAVEEAAHGELSASSDSASGGADITLTVKADKGYTLETLTVIDENGNEIELTDNGDGEYTFKMPEANVTVEVTFMEDNTALNFFVDVKASDYYYDSVLWAAENGITTGTDEVHFSPAQSCTRAQAVTFLWRAAQYAGVDVSSGEDTNILSYNDAFDIPEYAMAAMQWACAEGIIEGYDDGCLRPNDVCARSHIAAMIYRYEQSTGGGFKGTWMFRLPFTDVPEWAYEAIAWCYKENITNGTTDTTFSPDADCTRAQIVTFLYRAVEDK